MGIEETLSRGIDELDKWLSFALEQLAPFLSWSAAHLNSWFTWAGFGEVDETVLLVFWIGLLVAVVAMLWRVLRRTRRQDAESHQDLTALVRGPKRLGLAAAAIFLGIFVGWSNIAPLASAALAPGVISTDGHRKTVQHLEGGIVQTILVREGQAVTAGDPLITLDDTTAKALDAEIRERFNHLLAVEARLEAELADRAEIIFPAGLESTASLEFGQVLDGQRQLMKTRHETYLGRTQILQSRILQLEEQNLGLAEVIKASEEQLALIDEEIALAQDLLDQGLERRPRILALRRARAEITATRAVNIARVAENKQAIGETQLQLLTVGEERQEAIGSELANVQRVLSELRGQLPSREDILERTVIRAPIDGTVMQLRVTTVGGVVRPGEPLLDIVPIQGQMIIDARVRPIDIERVQPGISARVVLSAYKQRTLPIIHGSVRSISADAFVDERSGQSFFLAKVEVDPTDLAAIPDVQLIPGMPAEVMLLDGEQSLIDYLLAPLLESGSRGLRER